MQAASVRIKDTRHEASCLAPKPKGDLWILRAQENEAIGCGEPTVGELILKNERNCSENRMLHGKRQRTRHADHTNTATAYSRDPREGALCFLRRSYASSYRPGQRLAAGPSGAFPGK